MPKAFWNGALIAESDHTIKVEGNEYFPPESVRREYLAESTTHTCCPWKGLASYYDIVVDGKTNRDGAWYYPTPTSYKDRPTDMSGAGNRCFGPLA